MPRVSSAALAACAAALASAAPLPVDLGALWVPFEGVGALSGGGGVTRLLPDYPQELQADIYDALFKPNAGASLQFIKIEIGGDAQSTEGTESSISHFRGDLNCTRGYEWNVVAEARKRNPEIFTFGLSWGAPGWIGNGNYYSADNIEYHLNWIYCAETEWNFTPQYLGIWNERGADPTWTKELRAALDAAGYMGTRIVAADTGYEIVQQMQADPELAAAVDVVGVHYPGPTPAAAFTLNKSIWASEMWNLGKVNDYSGALTLASDLNDHGLWGLSTSIIWCLIYSWFAILPFSTPTETNPGAGHALLTAAEPWSGNWIQSPTLAAVAHTTQFAKPGWTRLAVGNGSGTLPGGGTYVGLVNTHVPSGVVEFSLILQTSGVSSPQTASFQLAGAGAGAALPSSLHVWQTTEDAYFVQQADVPVASDGTFAVTVPGNAIVSVTTTTGQGWVQPANPVPPSAPFPFPYADSFDTYAEGAYSKYFSDEGGVWVVQPIPADLLPNASYSSSSSSSASASGSALYNVVDVVPIAWEPNPCPYTLIGNFNGGANQSAWTDYTVSVSGMIDPSAGPGGVAYFADLQSCSGLPAQEWVVHGGSGSNITSPAYLESVAQPGMCLGINGLDPTTPGAVATGLVPCNLTAAAAAAAAAAAPTTSTSSTSRGGPSAPLSAYQTVQWLLNTSTAQIINANTLPSDNVQCLDVDGENKANGTRAITWQCKTGGGPDGPANQFWTVLPGTSGPNTVVLQSQFEGLCVDLVPGASSSSPFLLLSSRIHTYTRGGPPPDGYNFVVAPGNSSSANGSWQLSWKTTKLAGGDAGIPIVPGQWYGLSLKTNGTSITPSLNGRPLATVTDGSSGYGMVAVGSGWHHSWFDSFSVANNTQA